jgi:hypothetical protein
MSRQPTWDRACHIQADMFEEAAKIGGLEIMLVYFRGFRECRASKWHESAAPLRKSMLRIHCEGGYTQIARVLRKAIAEAKAGKIDAVVYIGDCCEEEIDPLCGMSGELGVMGVPIFIFQEGGEPYAKKVFREMARLSGGAWCPFDLASASQLRDLLRAVAVYAAGGRTALEDYGKRHGRDVKLLIDRFSGKR